VVRSIKLPNPASRFVDIEYESERSDDSSSDVSTSPRGGRRSQRESMDLRDPEKEKEKEKEREKEKEKEKSKDSKQEKEEIPVTKIWQDVASTTSLSWIIDYEELEIQEVIGTGGFGEVYKGLWRGTEVAVKKMKSDEMTEEEVRCFMDEIQMMR
jgi:hypothetical protein